MLARESFVFQQRRRRIGKHTGVGVLLGSNVVHLDDVAALEAALDGALLGDLDGRDLV
jgi:hypothetical protein